MKKLLLIFLLIPALAFASPPARTKTYVTNTTIQAADVSENEDNIFSYLTRGVDTYADSSIITDDILDGTIVNGDLSASLGLPDSKLATITTAGKVNGTALVGFTSIPSGAGLIPVANIDTGTTANKILKLDSNAKIPAVDASLLTGLTAAQIPNLAASIITSGTMTAARLGSGTTDSTTYLRGDSTFQLLSTLIAYGDTRYKIGVLTHDSSLTGAVQTTGIGFQPKCVIFYGVSGTATLTSLGFDDGTNHQCIYGATTASVTSTATSSYSIYLVEQVASKYSFATITATDSDSFTLTWSKTSTPTGTATIIYCAFR